MKASLFPLAIAVLALTGCTSEETDSPSMGKQAIGFTAVTKVASRAAVTSATNWTPDIHVASAYQASKDGTFSNLFGVAGDFVTFTYSSGIWTSFPIYYYPDDGKVDFLAYVSGTANDDLVEHTAALTRDASTGFKEMTLDFTSNKLKGQTDVMYALTTNVACPTTSSVALNFKHSLAWLTVTMSEATDNVLVKSLTVDGVYLTGKLTVPVTDRALGAPSWDVTGVERAEAVPFSAFCPADPTPVKDLNSSAMGVLVVPGAQTELTFTYRMVSNPTVDIVHTIDLGELDPWEAGKHYIYNITIGLTGITFTCNVDDYSVVNENASI